MVKLTRQIDTAVLVAPGTKCALASRATAAADTRPPQTERRASEHNNLRTLGRLWRRPVAWMAGGFGVIALGSVIINWLPEALGLR